MICNRSFAIKGTLTSHIRLHSRQHQKIKKLESTQKKINSVRNHAKPGVSKRNKQKNSKNLGLNKSVIVAHQSTGRIVLSISCSSPLESFTYNL